MKVKKHQSDQAKRKFSSDDDCVVFDIYNEDLIKGAGRIENIKMMLELIQLSNAPSIVQKFSLKEVEKSYKLLCHFYKDDVDLNLEYYYFLKNVMDNEINAKKFVLKYKTYILEKLNKID